jgi:hypothetical protein
VCVVAKQSATKGNNMDTASLELLLTVFGLLTILGVSIMVIRMLTIPLVVAAVVAITGWLAFFYAIGVDKV